jgi:predicted DNA-binding transcriptional regulator YafY
MPRKQGSHSQGVRLIRLLRRLQGLRQGAALSELEQEFGIGRAQLRRDLAALEEAGTALAFEREEGRHGRGRVRLVPGDSMDVTVTKSERLALLAARKVFEVFRGTELYSDIERIYAKLVDHLPESERRTLRPLAERIVYVPHGGLKVYDSSEDDEDTFDRINALQTAVMEQYRVRYAYRPPFGPRTSGVMEPYALVIYRNGLYVVASRIKEGGKLQPPRIFAVERFEEASFIRRSHFDRPQNLDIDQLFDDGMGIVGGNRTHHVIAEFSGWAAVEARVRRWHRSQQNTPLSDGTVRVELDIASLRDAANWIIEHGARARAVAPPELRRLVDAAHRDSISKAHFPNAKPGRPRA